MLVLSWLLALALGPEVLPALGLQLNEHGHAHLHPHGHPFIDARAFLGIPNALDVLTNLPFLILGLRGLGLLRGRAVTVEQRIILTTFFVGLILTGLGSAYYHWAPDAWGLMLDRLGMACAFAGILTLAYLDRLGPRGATWLLWGLLVIALVSAVLPYLRGQLLPWIVLQFGGMALLLVLACHARHPHGLGVAWWAVLAGYAAAKWLELEDATVFAATGELISGHSAKHLLAALAVCPVLFALARQLKKESRGS